MGLIINDVTTQVSIAKCHVPKIIHYRELRGHRGGNKGSKE